MSRQVVLRSFGRPNGHRERVRNLWQGLGSVLLHALVLLLLPGLAAQAHAPREIQFELLSDVTPIELPAGEELAEAAGIPDSTGIEPVEDTEVTEPGAGEPSASEPDPAEPETELVEAAAVIPEPELVNEEVTAEPETASVEIPVVDSTKLDSTEVDMSPPPVVESPVVVAPPPPPPALPEPVSEVKQPEPEPTPAPQPEPVSSVTQAEPQVEVDAETDGQGESESQSDIAGTAEQPGDGVSDTGEAEVPPPPPPGPTAAELSILNGYGDGALKRIKGQARQPEAGGQGVVKFAFIIDRNGHLVDVYIVKTSGRKLLDDDVLDATRAAFNDAWEIKPFPAGISLAEYEFERSITYPLY